MSLLTLAANGDTKGLRALLNRGANVHLQNYYGKTALMRAASNGHDACLTMLLDRGADVNLQDNDGETALMWAAREGHNACLKILLDRGANVNLQFKRGCALMPQNLNGWTALTWAAQNGHCACLTMLLDRGAGVNGVTKYGWTALMRAAREGHDACLKILLDRGADVNMKDIGGDTALIWAAMGGHGACLTMLLDRGADVNVADNGGRTALMWAAREGHDACLKMLLDRGADVNVQNKDGKTVLTALMLAAEKGHGACIKILLDSGAKVDEAVFKLKLSSEIEAMLLRQKLFEALAEAKQRDSSGTRDSEPAQPAERVESAVAGSPTTQIYTSLNLIPFADVKLGVLLGAGSFGSVHAASWQGTEVAVKMPKISDVAGSQVAMMETLLNKFKAEGDMMASVRHPHVVNFLGMCVEPLCIVTEQCSRGSLYSILEKAKNDPALAQELTWTKRLRLVADVASGMVYLHRRSPPILHRDMKSPNVLVSDAWRAKVADLGLSRIVEEVVATASVGTSMANINTRWLAAEVMENSPWLPASDVYAFGVVLWEVLTWELPWSHLSNPYMVSNSRFDFDDSMA